MNQLARGVWPVMLTPFREDGSLDWEGVDALTDWYIASGVAGLFAVCLSSEMYHLSPQERLQLASRVVERAAGRLPVVAAGAFGDSLEQQAERARRLADTGVTAVVLTANQLAAQDDPDTVWRKNAEALLDTCAGIPLGLYECPIPYHRTLSPELLGWAARSGRFRFFKDTCCRRDQIEAKLEAIRGTSLRSFNAHCPTLLHSLRAGGGGYSGIAANFYPELFVRLCAEFATRPAEAESLQRFLTLADLALRTRYPASAKRYLGLPVGPTCRVPVPAPPQNDDEALVLANLREAVAENKRAADSRQPPRGASVCGREPEIRRPKTMTTHAPFVRPLADNDVTLFESPDPLRVFAYSPGIARLESGRLIATLDLGGPGAVELPGPKWRKGETGWAWQGRALTSDNAGASWVERSVFPFMHARPFIAGNSLYVLGHADDLMILHSEDGGETWSSPLKLTDGQYWHQAPCNVHYANGCVYMVMERRTRFEVRGWYVGEMAPVLLRGRLGDDLTKRESWTFASELTFRDVMTETLPDHFGVPFYAADPVHGVMVTPTRHCNPMGWLETNVVQFADPDHLWSDPTGRTFHLWMRAHTGGTGYACIAKVVEQGDKAGTGAMTTMLEKAPSGKTMLYVPCPGG